RVVPASRKAAAPAQELPLAPPSRDALAKKEGRSEGKTSVSVDLINLVDRGRSLPLLLLVLLFSGRTILRNAVWWTDEGLFANLIRTSTDSAKAHYDVAYVAVANRQIGRAHV